MDDTRIPQELAEIDGVRARLFDLLDDGHVPFPETDYVGGALKHLYMSHVLLQKAYTPPTDEDAA